MFSFGAAPPLAHLFLAVSSITKRANTRAENGPRMDGFTLPLLEEIIA